VLLRKHHVVKHGVLPTPPSWESLQSWLLKKSMVGVPAGQGTDKIRAHFIVDIKVYSLQHSIHNPL